MPVGLTDTPATFQRTLDILLSEFSWRTWAVYLNDVIVSSKSFDAHGNDVDMVRTTLRKAGVSLILKK